MLLGRDDDLEALVASVAGTDRPLALYGEAGVGKTSLIRAVVARSGRLGFEAGCLASLSWMPYLPLHRAFGSRPDPVTGSRPGQWAALADLSSGDPAYVAAEVEAAVGDGVLVLDDVQWADAATWRVVPLLAGRVRMLAAVRRADPAAGHALNRLREAGFGVRDLDPLSAEHAAALARRIEPGLGPDAVASVVARSGGNPLLVEELAGTGVAGASLQLALAARMRRLPADCRELIGVLALAGRPLPVTALSGDESPSGDGIPGGDGRDESTSGDGSPSGNGGDESPSGDGRDDSTGGDESPSGNGTDTVARALESGLLVVHRGRATLRHGLLAEIAAAALDDDRRAELHARIAGLLPDPGEAARHLLAAGRRADAHAAAMRAAAAATSPGERAQHLGLAASCLDGADAARVRLDAAEQLAQVGQYAAAAPLLDGVDGIDGIDTADPVAAARVAAIRLRLAYEAMDLVGCRRSLAEGVAAAAGTGHPIEVQMACEEAFVALMVDFDVARSVALAHRAAGLADSRGVHRARARYILGTASYLAGGPDWEENLTAALDLARQEGEIAVECAAGNNLITAHESSGAPERGREIADHMIERSELLHLTEWRHQYEAMRLNLAWHAGDADAVLADGARLLAEPLRALTRRQVRMTICLALIDTGRLDEAYAVIDAITADESGSRETFQESIHGHVAEALLWDGKPGKALARWPEHRDSTTQMMDLLAFSAPTFAWAALLADEEVPDFGEFAPTTRMCRAGPIEVDAVRALHRGDHAVAADAFDAAARAWRPYNLRNFVRCSWGAAEAVRRSGRTDEAVTRLLAVERLAVRHRLLPLLGHIRASLRAAGVPRSAAREPGRRGPAQRGPAGGGATGVASLSGREREVLALVAQGLPDVGIGARLGISPRTVESQLASARRKLGARTRHQAAAMLAGSR